MMPDPPVSAISTKVRSAKPFPPRYPRRPHSLAVVPKDCLSIPQSWLNARTRITGTKLTPAVGETCFQHARQLRAHACLCWRDCTCTGVLRSPAPAAPQLHSACAVVYVRASHMYSHAATCGANRLRAASRGVTPGCAATGRCACTAGPAAWRAAPPRPPRPARAWSSCCPRSRASGSRAAAAPPSAAAPAGRRRRCWRPAIGSAPCVSLCVPAAGCTLWKR